MAGGSYTVADLDAAIAAKGLHAQLDGERRRLPCPAPNHPGDRSEANCSAWVGPDGSIGAKCHSYGCAHHEILEGLGLYQGSDSQGWKHPSSQHSNKRQPGPNDRTPASREKLGPIVAKHDYTDADGTLVYQVVRYAPKEFRQRQPDGKGGWIWNLAGVHRILYRLPELLAADPDQPVFVCEGEKDVDNLAALGLVATTSSGGAGKWQLINDLRPLEGRQVVILPDNDPGGQGLHHAEQVATSLQGIAASVKILELPDLPESGGDVSDWLDMGSTAERLIELAADTTKWTPPLTSAASASCEDLLERSKLDPGAPFEPEAIARLVALSAADWQRWRARLKEADTGVPVADLDAAIRAHGRDHQEQRLQGRPIEWPESEPWPEPVDGADLLTSLSKLITTYVYIPRELADALSLWIVHSYFHDRLEVSTFLNLTSATKRCGKSLLLEVLSELVYRPLPVAGNITPAALFRTIQKFEPTLLLDEIDTYLANDPELRGVLNGSQRRATATVIRVVGQDFDPQRFATWCPKVLVGIGGLPDTVLDRSLVLRLERRPPNAAPLLRWRDRDKAVIELLRRQLVRWLADNAEAILAARSGVDFPPALHDRARDAWEVLLATAAVAGDVWPERARAAVAAVVVSDASDEIGNRELLLFDLREAFTAHGSPDNLTTTAILESLHEKEGRPWGEWRSGRPLTSRGLSSLLKPFGIKPKQWRSGSERERGYARADLEPIWGQYCPSTLEPVEATRDTCDNPVQDSTSTVSRPVTDASAVTGCKTEKSPPRRIVTGVTDRSPAVWRGRQLR